MRRVAQRVPLIVALISMAGFIAIDASPSGAAAAVVSGTVKDTSGAPIAGAIVGLSDPDSNSAKSTTDASGAYAVTVPTGLYQLALTWHPFSGPGDTQGISQSNIAVAGAQTVDITVPIETAVNVHLVDSANAPIAGAQISSDNFDFFAGPSLSDGTAMTFATFNTLVQTTDAGGDAALPALLGDPAVQVDVTPPDRLSYRTTVNVATDPTPLTVSLAPSVIVSGTVKDTTGSPIAGAGVGLSGPQHRALTTTDVSGAYALHVPTGNYFILATWSMLSGDGYAEASAPNVVVSGNETLDITVPKETTIDTHVVDSASAPIVGAQVFGNGSFFAAPPLSDGTPMQVCACGTGLQTTDAGGNASTPALVGDPEVFLRATRPNGRWVSTFVNVATDPTPVTVEIPATATVSGTVKDTAGTPVAGVKISLLDQRIASTTTDASGASALHVPTGSYSMELAWNPFSGAGEASATSATNVVVNGNQTLNITIPAEATVNTHVVDSSNAAVAGALVAAYGHSFRGPALGDGTAMDFFVGASPEGTSDASGNASFPALLGDPANFVTVSPPSALSVNTSVNVAANPTSVTIGISYSNAAVVSSVGGVSGPVTVSSPPGTRLFNVTQQTVPAGSLPGGAVAVIGSSSYSVGGVAVGATADIVLNLPPGSNPTGVYKLSGSTLTEVSSLATIVGNQITLHLTDGGLGDDDGVANGVIVDPVVPYRNAAPPPPTGSVPGAPKRIVAVPGNKAATVSWTAPASNGSSITGYHVSALLGKAVAKSVPVGVTTKATIGGLVNGKQYTFTVAAQNALGFGASSKSSSITVGAPSKPTTVTSTKASAGTLKITFKAPGSNGTPITGYDATCSSPNGGVSRSKTGKASPIKVTGLTKTKRYTCTVKATNSRGTGPPSAPSTAVKA